MINIMEEIWKNIEGYENLYQVSNIGRVKSLGNGSSNNSKERFLKSTKNTCGYLFVILYKEGKGKSHKVHRLVAQAFLPNHNNLPQVNHKDEDKTNNRVENLEWCDAKYNNNYGSRTEKRRKPILQFTKNNEFVRRWDSIIEVEKELGFKHSNISKCCKGKNKSVGGFIWGYADDYEKIKFNVFDLEIYEKKVA
jgi:hypothetical protein